ncbi:MAG: hypothetical protein JNN07_16635 [Verrucomicrobiales bacterium]|nr:hypothetical protein [Verrucomicrobiales bacterium]
MKRVLTTMMGLSLAGGAFAGTLQEGLVVHLNFDGNIDDTTGHLVGDFAPRLVGQANTEGEGRIGSGALKFWSYKTADLVPEGEEQFNFLQLGASEDEPSGTLDFGVDKDFSAAFWVKFNSWSGDPSFFGNKNWNSGGNVGYVLATAGNGGFQWNYRESGNPRLDYDGGAHTIDGGSWHHIVVTVKRDGNATTYLDGVQVDSRPVVTRDVDGNWVQNSLRSGLGINLGQDGTGSYTDGGSVGIADGQMDDFGLWHRELAASEVGRIYSAALEGINISAVPDPKTPAIVSMIPTDGATAASPDGSFSATVENAGTALDPASVKLFFDGNVVPHVLTVPAAGKNVITYSPAGLLAANSAHTYRLEFSDNGSPVVKKVQSTAFTVADYTDITLPTAIHLETFESAEEGDIPAGWTRKNYTSGSNGTLDLNSPNSDSYLDFTVITKERFAQVFDTRRLSVRPYQVVNGKVLTTLIEGKLCYGESDNRSGNQFQLLYSPDYDLTGKTDVYLSWNSIYEQNQDSLGGVEYSIDEGATWEPVLYMIDAKDIILGEDGLTDAANTLSSPRGDTAKFSDPETGVTGEGNYGSFIGVTEDRWGSLAPYISGRVDDDSVESKRVEIYRLPLADNQPKVRLRFAHAGTGSWYFGIDNVGFYSKPASVSPSLSFSTVGGLTLTFAGGKLQSKSSITGEWTDVVGAASPYTVTPSGDKAFFRVAQ